MGSRLSNSPSPYLRQHADNPVDWHPWNDEAFARARELDRPVFLSVGYSSCHWCHVMAHESFEDADIAEILNASFVSVKVDREERPDVDHAYMTAVQLQNGHGGWPMSVFLTPDRKPFFAGTYFPREDRGKHPGFRTLLLFIARMWAEERSSLLTNAVDFARALAEALDHPGPPGDDLDPSLIAKGVEELSGRFDSVNGGFTDRPKFPSHTAIHFLLSAQECPAIGDPLRRIAAEMVEATLRAMALGGIHDHVGGGFARYSTDEAWHLPHFEKMLSDNAQLLHAYARAGESPTFRRAAAGIVRWLRDEMTLPDGTFATALDADTDGEEGATYLWSTSELRDALGAGADPFITHFGARDEGNYHDEATGRLTGMNVLHASATEPDFAEALTMLAHIRRKRPQPGRDDKAVACWNGMAIGALAEAGEIEMATRAGAVWAEAIKDGVPRHLSQGRAWGAGFLEDYAHLVQAFDALSASGGERRWRDLAEQLADQMVERFLDGERGFASTSASHEVLFGRVRPWFDEAQPSGNAAAIRALLSLNRHEQALQALRAGAGWMRRAPGATEALHECLIDLIGWVAQSSARSTARPSVVVDWGGTELVGLEGLVRVVISDGLHLNSSNPPAKWLIPTVLGSNPPGIQVDYPASADPGYKGEMALRYRLPSPGEYELVLGFQACTDSECLTPEERRFIVRAGLS